MTLQQSNSDGERQGDEHGKTKDGVLKMSERAGPETDRDGADAERPYMVRVFPGPGIFALDDLYRAARFPHLCVSDRGRVCLHP